MVSDDEGDDHGSEHPHARGYQEEAAAARSDAITVIGARHRRRAGAAGAAAGFFGGDSVVRQSEKDEILPLPEKTLGEALLEKERQRERRERERLARDRERAPPDVYYLESGAAASPAAKAASMTGVSAPESSAWGSGTPLRTAAPAERWEEKLDSAAAAGRRDVGLAEGRALRQPDLSAGDSGWGTFGSVDSGGSGPPERLVGSERGRRWARTQALAVEEGVDARAVGGGAGGQEGGGMAQGPDGLGGGGSVVGMGLGGSAGGDEDVTVVKAAPEEGHASHHGLRNKVDGAADAVGKEAAGRAGELDAGTDGDSSVATHRADGASSDGVVGGEAEPVGVQTQEEGVVPEVGAREVAPPEADDEGGEQALCAFQ